MRSRRSKCPPSSFALRAGGRKVRADPTKRYYYLNNSPEGKCPQDTTRGDAGAKGLVFNIGRGRDGRAGGTDELMKRTIGLDGRR